MWKSTEHKLHNIWRSLKFQQNEHTPGVLRHTVEEHNHFISIFTGTTIVWLLPSFINGLAQINWSRTQMGSEKLSTNHWLLHLKTAWTDQDISCFTRCGVLNNNFGYWDDVDWIVPISAATLSLILFHEHFSIFKKQINTDSIHSYDFLCCELWLSVSCSTWFLSLILCQTHFLCPAKWFCHINIRSSISGYLLGNLWPPSCAWHCPYLVFIVSALIGSATSYWPLYHCLNGVITR